MSAIVEKRSQADPAYEPVESRRVHPGAEKSSARRPAGFTLLEITIALGMLGLILSALYGSYRAVADSILGIQPQITLDQRGRLFVQQLSRQVRCCYSNRPNPLRRPTSREDRTTLDRESRLSLFRGGDTSRDESLLRYVTSTGTRTQRNYPGCMTVVSYKLDTWQRTLSVREELYGQHSDDEDENWRVILEDVLEIEFAYFDGKDWQDEWDSQKAGGLPCAMRVTFLLGSSSDDCIDWTSVIPILCSEPARGRVSTRTVPTDRDKENEQERLRAPETSTNL